MDRDDVIAAFRDTQIYISNNDFYSDNRFELEIICERMITFLKYNELEYFRTGINNWGSNNPDRWDTILDLVFEKLDIENMDQLMEIIK